MAPITISLYLDVRTHFQGPPRSVCMAHIKALRRGMVSSLMRRGICGREVWKMLDGELEVGYTLVFLYIIICFRDPLSPKAHCFPSSHPTQFSELILLLLLYIADF